MKINSKKMNKEKCNKTKGYFLIIIIITIVLIIGGFILNTYGDTSKNKNASKDDNPSTFLKEYNKYYSALTDKINELDSFLGTEYPINDFNKLSNNKKTLFLLRKSCGYDADKVSVSDLKKIGEDYFEEFDVLEKSFKGKNGKVVYKYKNHGFSYFGEEEYDYFVYSRLISNNISGNEWKFKRKIYYEKFKILENGTNEISVYRTLDDVLKDKVLKKFTSSILTLTVEEVESIEDSLITASYTFEKIDGKYLIKSIKFE